MPEVIPEELNVRTVLSLSSTFETACPPGPMTNALVAAEINDGVRHPDICLTTRRWLLDLVSVVTTVGQMKEFLDRKFTDTAPAEYLRDEDSPEAVPVTGRQEGRTHNIRFTGIRSTTETAFVEETCCREVQVPDDIIMAGRTAVVEFIENMFANNSEEFNWEEGDPSYDNFEAETPSWDLDDPGAFNDLVNELDEEAEDE